MEIEPHPWGEFLNARLKCIKFFIDSGKDLDDISETLSMDVHQLHRIHRILNANRMLTNDTFDPPPWQLTTENEQKTEGWIERQRWERENRK